MDRVVASGASSRGAMGRVVASGASTKDRDVARQLSENGSRLLRR